jgi:hypothetical protein
MRRPDRKTNGTTQTGYIRNVFPPTDGGNHGTRTTPGTRTNTRTANTMTTKKVTKKYPNRRGGWKSKSKSKSKPAYTRWRRNNTRVVVVKEVAPKKPSEKVTIQTDVREQTIYAQGPKASESFVRIPISGAIPTHRHAGAGPDVRYRTSNMVEIVAINLRFWLAITGTTRVLAAAYENRHQSSDVTLIGTPPAAFQWGIPESTTTSSTTSSRERRMLTALEAGMMSIHGPFEMRNVHNYVSELDSTDGTPFTARLSKAGGKAIGRWSWKDGDKQIKNRRILAREFNTSLMRTSNWDQSGDGTGGQGWIQSVGQNIEVYCELGVVVEMANEVETLLKGISGVEMVLGVDMPGAGDYVGRTQVTGGTIRGLSYTIYYKNL